MNEYRDDDETDRMMNEYDEGEMEDGEGEPYEVDHPFIEGEESGDDINDDEDN